MKIKVYRDKDYILENNTIFFKIPIDYYKISVKELDSLFKKEITEITIDIFSWISYKIYKLLNRR